MDNGSNPGWPRFMSESAPDAVGSLWDELGPWLAGTGIVLRPWQELVARRAFEVDQAGGLCWRTVVVSTPRQSGKSHLLKAVALCRASHPDLFGEPQTVAHVANRHVAARRIHTLAWGWAERNGLLVRTAVGGERIIWPDGSCWNVNTLTNVYGESAGAVLLDEVWDVTGEDYREGLRPTQVERCMPQLWAFSTAHRRAQGLMPELMADGRAGRARTLLADWGAPVGADPDDPWTWECASPHWSVQRGDEMALAAGTAGFAEQWLNVWPSEDVLEDRWVPRSVSDAASVQRVGPIPAGAVCALECTPDGRRWAVAAAWPRGRSQVVARVWLVDSARRGLSVVGQRQLYAHQAVTAHPDMLGRAVEPVTMSVGRAATTELRDALMAGHLRVVGMSDEQWSVVGTMPADGGEVVSATRSQGDVHAVKALSWAVWAVQSQRSRCGLVM